MLTNIIVAVILAVFAALVSGLAGHLAATKPWQKWLFWGSGAVMIILIGFQTYRNETAQTELRDKLDKIEKNTKNPPVYNVPPAQVVISPQKQSGYLKLGIGNLVSVEGPKINASGSCQNTTGIATRNTACGGNIYAVPAAKGFPAAETEEKYWKLFVKETLPHLGGEGQTLAPTEYIYGTLWITNEPVTEDMLQDLSSGDKVILVVQVGFFNDDLGRHRIESCAWAQAPFKSGTHGIWHVCKKHNGMAF